MAEQLPVSRNAEERRLAHLPIVHRGLRIGKILRENRSRFLCVGEMGTHAAGDRQGEKGNQTTQLMRRWFFGGQLHSINNGRFGKRLHTYFGWMSR